MTKEEVSSVLEEIAVLLSSGESCQPQHLVTNGPEQVLSGHPLFERQVAQREQGQTLFFVLERVMPGFEQVFSRQVTVGGHQVLHHLRVDLPGNEQRNDEAPQEIGYRFFGHFYFSYR